LKLSWNQSSLSQSKILNYMGDTCIQTFRR